MPPRGHSSSSHSSRSHSSHRSSHRSSSGGYHGHSSSSHSSSSNRSSGTSSSRPRVNQPRGFYNPAQMHTYRCRKHDYVFYPTDWVDSETGTLNKKGYYDENGNHYEALILKHNQKYENVPLRCEYCGTTSIRDLTDDNQTMTCENCGANMIIEAVLDDPADTESGYSSSRAKGKPAVAVLVTMGIILFIYCVPVLLASAFFMFHGMLKKGYDSGKDSGYDQVNDSQNDPEKELKEISNVDIFGSTIYLKDGTDGYTISDSDDYDKVLYWDYSYESYYDKESDCYVWYNTDVSPNLWQYWYEDISSDYGDYGWMEYEDGEWYIERRDEDWILLDTDKYDTSELWHFDSASDVGGK